MKRRVVSMGVLRRLGAGAYGIARRPLASVRLVVPESLGRNSPTVTALMTPEESGQLLLDLMRQRLGLASYDDVALLDFGCGARFTQAIVNRGPRIGRYVGVDVSCGAT